jgi:hypothetical protein
MPLSSRKLNNLHSSSIYCFFNIFNLQFCCFLLSYSGSLLFPRYPDPEAGEVPIAYVVRSPNSSLSEADVQKFIEKQVRRLTRILGLIVTRN